MENVTSKFLSLNAQDYGKAFLVGFLTAFIASSGQWCEAWITSPDLAIDKVSIILSLKAGFAGGMAYLVKQVFSGPKKTDDEHGTGSQN